MTTETIRLMNSVNRNENKVNHKHFDRTLKIIYYILVSYKFLNKFIYFNILGKARTRRPPLVGSMIIDQINGSIMAH